MVSATRNKFSADFRDRAVRMVDEHRGGCPPKWAAITSIAGKVEVSSRRSGASCRSFRRARLESRGLEFGNDASGFQALLPRQRTRRKAPDPAGAASLFVMATNTKLITIGVAEICPVIVFVVMRPESWRALVTPALLDRDSMASINL